jgi:phosphatidylglycerol---prolipoprotein diacylglyceryl transferase
VIPVLNLGLWGWQFQVASYSLFLTLAGVATVALGLAVATRRGLPAGRSLTCLLAMAVAMLVGARLLDAATKGDVYTGDPGRLLRLDFLGFSLFGGGLLALLAGVLACRLVSLDLVKMADSVAPALGVGIALARIGCFLAGCCFGAPTTLPWGVTFPFGSEAHLHQLFTGSVPFGGGPLPVHPTELYELTAALMGATLAVWLLSRRVPNGSAFLAFVFWFTAFRWANEYFRAPSLTLNSPPWFYPLLYASILAIAGSFLALRVRKRRVMSS